MITEATTFQPADTLGARIAASRRALGLTQEQLGQGLAADGGDLGKGAVSSWEVDRSQPSAAQIAILAVKLKVSGDYLLGLASASYTAENNPGRRADDKARA